MTIGLGLKMFTTKIKKCSPSNNKLRQPLISQALTHVPKGIRLRVVYSFSSVAQAVTPAMSVKPTQGQLIRRTREHLFSDKNSVITLSGATCALLNILLGRL